MILLLVVLLVIAAIIALFIVGVSGADDAPARLHRGLRQLDNNYFVENARQEHELTRFLIELHQRNRETYRLIKEAGRKA
jgi:hypothetical protein